MKSNTKVFILFGIAVVVASAIAWNNNDYNKRKERFLNSISKGSLSIENQVARDAVDQYVIAAKGGDKMQMYSCASMCVAAYLQAKDEANYLKWLEIQHNLGKKIGVPQY